MTVPLPCARACRRSDQSTETADFSEIETGVFFSSLLRQTTELANAAHDRTPFAQHARRHAHCDLVARQQQLVQAAAAQRAATAAAASLRLATATAAAQESGAEAHPHTPQGKVEYQRTLGHAEFLRDSATQVAYTALMRRMLAANLTVRALSCE